MKVETLEQALAGLAESNLGVRHASIRWIYGRTRFDKAELACADSRLTSRPTFPELGALFYVHECCREMLWNRLSIKQYTFILEKAPSGLFRDRWWTCSHYVAWQAARQLRLPSPELPGCIVFEPECNDDLSLTWVGLLGYDEFSEISDNLIGAFLQRETFSVAEVGLAKELMILYIHSLLPVSCAYVIASACGQREIQHWIAEASIGGLTLSSFEALVEEARARRVLAQSAQT